MVERSILHIDINNFYASVECLYNPALQKVPMAVGGDPARRHGIVLAKNQIAKGYGVSTGEALWQARQKCPGIVFVPPRFGLYLRFSQMTRAICAQYTDQVEPFGLDESWLDVTDSRTLFGSGAHIAEELRGRVKTELGITASVGVSFNKIFAKLGSDLKKPDATTEIRKEDFREKVWPLPVSKLLYVGPATNRKLSRYGIHTIGALARSDPRFLKDLFGKNGEMLWRFANGLDTSTVSRIGERPQVKSVGNSTTAPRDLICAEDIRITLYVLAESVAARLRDGGLLCRTVQLSVRDSALSSFERQATLPAPQRVSAQLAEAAWRLFAENVRPPYKIRSLGVRACGLTPEENCQLSLLPERIREQKQEDLETAVQSIRRRFGHHAIARGIMLTDQTLSHLNPKEDHIVHPLGFLGVTKKTWLSAKKACLFS